MKKENMKEYDVQLPFSGSLGVRVTARNEEEAEKLGRELIEKFNDDDIFSSIEWEHYEVYES